MMIEMVFGKCSAENCRRIGHSDLAVQMLCFSANTRKTRQGRAWRGWAWHGVARRGKARQGKAGRGRARLGKAGRGWARQGTAGQGTAWHGVARQGGAGQGKWEDFGSPFMLVKRGM